MRGGEGKTRDLGHGGGFLAVKDDQSVVKKLTWFAKMFGGLVLSPN